MSGIAFCILILIFLGIAVAIWRSTQKAMQEKKNEVIERKRKLEEALENNRREQSELKETIKNLEKEQKELSEKQNFSESIETALKSVIEFSSDFTNSKIVGVTFENDKGVPIQSILPNIKEGEKLTFERNPLNEYDSNAIKVIWNGQHIGHLSKELAVDLAPMIDEGAKFIAYVNEITGGNDKKYGCNIRIEEII